jgi:hypothetical protein
LRDYPGSEFYVPMFRNTLSIPSLWVVQELAYNTNEDKIQTPGNHPKERIQHSKHDESLRSRIWILSLKKIM